MSGRNFLLSWVEHEKSFITLGPDLFDTLIVFYEELFDNVDFERNQHEKLPIAASIKPEQRWPWAGPGYEETHCTFYS